LTIEGTCNALVVADGAYPGVARKVDVGPPQGIHELRTFEHAGGPDVYGRRGGCLGTEMNVMVVETRDYR
jgi:hypothetical protein